MSADRYVWQPDQIEILDDGEGEGTAPAEKPAEDCPECKPGEECEECHD